MQRDAEDRKSGARPATRYTATARWLHWITALLMLATIPLAWQVHVMARGVPMRAVFFTGHKSIGVTILLLAVARLIWRRRHPPPPAPTWPRWAALLAKANHVLLYVVLLAMPLTGYVHSATSGVHPVNYFGLFYLPALPQDDAVSEVTLDIHFAMQWLVYALIVLHVLGAAWHVVVRRDGALERMLPPQTGAL